MTRHRDLPPARAEALLRRLAPGRSARFLVADLGQEYRELRQRRSAPVCRLWYWAQALVLSLRLGLHRARGGSPVLPRPERATMFDTLSQDLRFAFRTLARSPSYTLVAVLALTTGIGISTAIFSVVYGVLQSLPYPGGERIVLAYEGDAETRDSTLMLSPPEILALEELEGEIFETVAAYSYGSAVLEGDPNPERMSVPRISHDFMEMLRARPHLGRSFGPADDADSRVVVLGYRLWQRRFGGDPEIVGEDILLDDVAHTVIGVTGPEFTYFNDTDRLFRPLAFTAEESVNPRTHSVYPLARLREGMGLDDAERRIAPLIAARQEAVGHSTGRPHDVWLYSLYEAWVGSVRTPLLVLLGAVGLLTLIACANVASLQLARGLGRGRELAMRLALGARRGRILRQLITESALLALIGGALGLVLAWSTVGWLRRLVEQQLPRTENIHVDLTVLAFTLAVSMAAGIASGLVPAWVATRGDLTRPLSEGSNAIAGAPGSRLRAGLLVMQLALAMILAVGAGLLVRSFEELRGRDLGFAPEDVVVTSLSLWGRDGYSDAESITGFFDQVLERTAGLPGVEAVGAMNFAPGVNVSITNSFFGEDAVAPDEPVEAGFHVVTPGTFAGLQMKLVRGRDFDSRDRPDAPPVVVVNEALARRLWPGGDALGRRLKEGKLEGDSAWITVVGVVGDVRHTPLGEPDTPRVYLPQAQRPQRGLAILARLGDSGGDFGGRFRRAVAEIDPTQPVDRVDMLPDMLAGLIAEERVNSALLGLFAALAVALAAVGEYAVIQYTVVQRSGEIGIRMALGAGSRRVLSLVLRQGMSLAVVGVGLGIVGAWASSRLVVSMLHGVEPTDPLTYAGVATLLLTVAAAACLLPARRASRIDPVETLRRD